MRAGKKQVAESGKTRPCIVYVKNLREEAEPAGGRLRKRDPRELQQLQHKREQQALRETPSRRAGRSESVAIQKKPLARTRQAVAAKSPAAAAVESPSPPKVTRATTATTTPAAVMAKRRSTLVLGNNSHHKLTGIGPRRGTHTETPHVTPKMFKQTVAKHLAPSSPPPTIAASRSRRSIKPNPKYASEDVVTPKYMSSLGGDGSPVSGVSRHRSQAKSMYVEMNDLDLDLDEDDEDEDEDDDDELADAAFNPQLHKSDEDDDEEFVSDGEFEQELRLEKQQPVVKRGRGRPPKNNNLRTPSSAAAAASTSSTSASNRVFQKFEVNSGQGRTTTMQQLRRTLAGTTARNNASMMADGGAKRKLEVSESESPVARKRLVISSASGTGQRSVPVVNGATTKRSITPSAHAHATISRPRTGGGGGASNTSRMQPQQRTADLVFKVNSSGTPTTNIPNATTNSSSTRSTRGAAAAAGAASEASPKSESEATFTIVNIDDIMNQDDVLISRANTALAAAAARAVGASKKLAKGRLRIKDILATSETIGAALEKKLSSMEKSAAVSNSSSSQAAKRLKILASNSNSSGNASKPRTASSQVAAPPPQSAAGSKPRPRILNTEMGKKTQPMKPLMSMGKELCPTDVDTEEDDPDPDLDLDLDLDLDEPPASIVTRRTPRQAPGAGAGAAPAELGSAGNASASNKWSSTSTSRRKVLATTASTANARAEKRVTKLTGDAHDEPAVFKKPGGSPQLRSKENQQQDKEEASSKKKDTAASTAAAVGLQQASSSPSSTVLSSPQKYFPPETTIFSEEEGRLVKKITCYETWHVINLPTEPPSSGVTSRQQRTCLELELVTLANVAARLKVPSSKWSSKVTLYKVSPTLMQRQKMIIFTGDLNAYNIPEEDRHKYQPSCVLFRRTATDRTKSRVPYDRAIIFKNKCFYANIDGKQVNLLGAPESVVSIKEVEILLDIVDRLTLNSQLVEMVNTK